MLTAYYNENDPYAAQWLRNLIAAGEIPAGDVDEQSIVDVRPEDLEGYSQCHFFGGIGGWAHALCLAGWPEDRPVWTGSCPCQPFSSAGRQGGTSDERHLWPPWLRLVRECRPDTILGEQVEGAVGFGWIDRVFADLEAEGYTCGATVLGAHSVGAPHIRQRLWWVADAGRQRDELDRHKMGRAARAVQGEVGQQRLRPEVGDGSTDGGVAVSDGGDARSEGLQRSGQHRQQPQDSGVGGVGNTDETGSQGRGEHAGECADQRSPWAASELIPCADGKARRVGPGVQPLAHGVSARVGKLRAAGNAIVPQVAAEFIQAFLAAEADMRRTG